MVKKTSPRLKVAVRQPVEPRPPAPAALGPGGGPGDGPAVIEPLDAARQAEAFEAAAALFHAGQFESAQRLFRQATLGPIRDMAHSAALHARMCQRRLESLPAPRSAEDHYHLAVALLNERRLQAAEEHLRAALAQTPDNDHLYYVLALCRALAGDSSGAYTLLKRAIELQPRNRIAARNDPDFAELGQQPPLFELLYPEQTRLG